MSLSGLFACLDPCKGIQDSLGFWIPSRGFMFRWQRNLDFGLQSLVGSALLVIFSNAQDCGFHKQKSVPDSEIRITIHRALIFRPKLVPKSGKNFLRPSPLTAGSK